MTTPYRQEVLNVVMAQLLQERGIVSAPEQMFRTLEEKRRMPDVIVSYYGLRTAIEGEIAYRPQAHDLALDSATDRVYQGIAHIGIAVVYPEDIRGTEFSELKDQLADAALDMAVVSESGTTGYVNGNIDYLRGALTRTFEQLIKEDIVTQAVAKIDAAIERFASVVTYQKGAMGRIRNELGIKELPDIPKNIDANEKIAKIAGLVLINAMIFQDIIAKETPRVSTLVKIMSSPSPPFSHQFIENWIYILDEINYYSIFQIAKNIMASFTSVETEVKILAETAADVVTTTVALRHDLMGRIYHRLLLDAKYLGTYYTTIPAAVILLKLALRNGDIDWSHLDQISKLRVSDLSCGTGTLLMAAADAITDNYVSQAATEGKSLDLLQLQQHLVEDVLYGYDVLPSALHLTASTLALRAADAPFRKMNLFNLPLGGRDLQLGSLEFLNTSTIAIPFDMFGAHITTEKEEKVITAPLPQLDLCVMNPPFTRSVGGNLLFGSIPDTERNKMQTKLKTWLREGNLHANITTGLGSVFLATADPYIKVGGRLAVVLPKALLSGVAWQKSRELLARKYQVEYIVVSHDADHWNFSESTDLSECLLVAKKVNENFNGNGNDDEARVVIVNLWRNPQTSFDALAVARDASEYESPDILTGQGALTIETSEYKIGEATSISWEYLKTHLNWGMSANFAQADVTRTTYRLLDGKLKIPGIKKTYELPLTELKNLADLGYDRRDIHDGFSVTETLTAFPTFWGHSTKTMFTLAQKPNKYLSPLAFAKPRRNLRNSDDLWSKSGKILVSERLGLSTHRLTSVRMSKPVLSNVWWTMILNSELATDEVEKALVLWFNSTLNLLIMFGSRVETHGAWVDFKKPNTLAMPVLDIRQLNEDQLGKLASVYDRVCEKTLLRFPEMATDPVRAEIDEVIVDVLALPDISILRGLLAQEPVVCMKSL